jgi:hypothetical protein
MTTHTLQHKHLMTLSLDVASDRAANIGVVARGRRTIVPIMGGRFSGTQLSGTVMPGGADWVILRSDGVMEIDVRITLETHSGALIYLTYTGFFSGAHDAMKKLAKGEVLHDSDFNLTVTARAECSDEGLAWLNTATIVGVGTQSGFNPTYDFFVVG